MYVPPAFAETDQAKLHAFIERHSFGLLVSTVDGRPFATHLPFLLDRQTGAHGTLIGHVARANPHWESLDGAEVLAVFSGPHAYVSPTWYDAENVVPTWNYTAVHAYGRATLVRDEDAVHKIVADSVALYESGMDVPWTLADNTFVRRLLAQIVGFRIEITRLEGKFKLNQNHPAERREKVARALRGRGGDAEAIADMIRDSLGGGA